MGFIELAEVSATGAEQIESDPNSDASRIEKSRVKRAFEKSWPIQGHLKHEKAEDLFAWIGDCIAEVVEDGMQSFGNELPEEMLMGVTFSFPMMCEICVWLMDVY